MCSKKLLISGLEPQRVKIGEVGSSTINYQQYLHRLFFGCNVLYKYRGLREDRIKTTITVADVALAEKKLNKMLLSNTFVYKQNHIDKSGNHVYLYNEIIDVRNVTKRLLYNILLYYISYYIIENQSFRSDAHFNSSMIYNLHTNIENIYIRTKNKKLPYQKSVKYNIPSKQYYWLFDNINNLISNMLVKCISRE
jgi:hypothetical protein